MPAQAVLSKPEPRLGESAAGSTADQLLARLDQQLDRLRAERAGYLQRLGNEPENGTLDKKIAAVEVEISTTQGTRARILAARAEALQRAGRAALLKQLKTDAREVDRLGAEMAEVTESLAAHVLRMRPMLERFTALSNERASLAWGVVSAGTDRRSERAGIRARAALADGPLAAWIEGAFRLAGVGTLPLTMEIKLPLPPVMPARDGWSGPPGLRVKTGPDVSAQWRRVADGAELKRLAREWLADENAGVAGALGKAISAVEVGDV